MAQCLRLQDRQGRNGRTGTVAVAPVNPVTVAASLPNTVAFRPPRCACTSEEDVKLIEAAEKLGEDWVAAVTLVECHRRCHRRCVEKSDPVISMNALGEDHDAIDGGRYVGLIE
jgi:hypothetical protein